MESWAIIAIVAILASFVGGIVRRMLSYRSEVGSKTETDLANIRERLAAIEATMQKADVVQRLNALEAIVTDSKFDVKRQIDSLESR